MQLQWSAYKILNIIPILYGKMEFYIFTKNSISLKVFFFRKNVLIEIFWPALMWTHIS